jgi:hypothetical protein
MKSNNSPPSRPDPLLTNHNLQKAFDAALDAKVKSFMGFIDSTPRADQYMIDDFHHRCWKACDSGDKKETERLSKSIVEVCCTQRQLSDQAISHAINSVLLYA